MFGIYNLKQLFSKSFGRQNESPLKMVVVEKKSVKGIGRYKILVTKPKPGHFFPTFNLVIAETTYKLTFTRED